MVALLADESFNNVILRGLLRRASHVDVVRVQDVGLEGAEDPEVLHWAAEHGRVLVTHDVATMPMSDNEEAVVEALGIGRDPGGIDRERL